MQCPKCPNSPLVATPVQAIEVDRCKACGGIWFDNHELIPLLHEKISDLAALQGKSVSRGANQKHGLCPRDNAGLLRVSSALGRSVILDTCPECRGIWLDGGEFDTLLKSVAQ